MKKLVYFILGLLSLFMLEKYANIPVSTTLQCQWYRIKYLVYRLNNSPERKEEPLPPQKNSKLVKSLDLMNEMKNQDEKEKEAATPQGRLNNFMNK